MVSHRESIARLFHSPLEGGAVVCLWLGLAGMWFVPWWLSVVLILPHYLLGLRARRITLQFALSLWMLSVLVLVQGRASVFKTAMLTGFGGTVFMILRDLPDVGGAVPLPYLKDSDLCDGGTPFTLDFDYHRPLLAFTLLSYIYDGPMIHSFADTQQVLLDSLSLAFGCATVSFFFASAILGMYDVYPKFPPFTAIWAVNTLLLDSINHELLFRGVVLSALQSFLSPMEAVFAASALSACCSAVPIYLFHGVHAAVSQVLLSSVKGVFFGFAFELSEMVEAAILCSFFWDCLHFLFFTYPLVDFGAKRLDKYA